MNDDETKILGALYDESRARFKSSFYWDSMALAMRDTVIALEARVTGVSHEEAASAFDERRKKHHQHLLEKLENRSPELAADADGRTEPELPESL